MLDRSSQPTRSPAATGDDIADPILELRRTEKGGNERVAAHLADRGIRVDYLFRGSEAGFSHRPDVI